MHRYGVYFFLVCLLVCACQISLGNAGKNIIDGTTLPLDARRLGHSKRLQSSNITLPDLYEASIEELQSGLDQGLFTSVDLVTVRLWLARC